ncbi:MAG TPA: cytochrome c oxidase subunit 3 [Candidatus Acidoferrum sp.]|nr:cytochrome c oxidase subunit 3 [Candidatus Acidoferrum sp.]
MASFATTATVDDPRVSRGDNGGLPTVRDGGGDDGPGPTLPDYATRLRRARLGLLVALTPVLMLFVSFTSAYVVRQGLPTLDPRTNQLVRDWIPVKLPALLLVNTGVLLLSSVGMELARRQIKREAATAPAGTVDADSGREENKIPWLAMTVVLGLLFLAGQWTAWRQLAANGFYVSTTPSSSFVYLLTGTHAVHLMGGVLALLAAGVFALLRRSVATRSIVVDVTAWYWHFMAALWVYIFCLMKFAS